MSIEIIDQKLKDRVVEIEKGLDLFEQNTASLPQFQKVECPTCLSLSTDDLKRRSPEDLIDFSFQINMYLLYLQRLINRTKSLERWGKAKLDEIAAGEIPSIGNEYGFNERMLMAKNQSSICKRLNAFITQRSMELDRLHYVPEQIKIISETIRDMRFVAMKKEKQYE